MDLALLARAMQQPVLPWILAAALFGATPRRVEAAHVVPEGATAPAGTPPPAIKASPSGFGLALAAAYAAPVALFVAGAMVGKSDRDAGHVVAYTALAGFAVPPLVRFAHDAGSDIPIAVLGTLGFAGGGTLAGLLIGGSLCDRDSEFDCIATPIQGAAIGLFAGYVAWAVIDSVFFAYPPARPSSSAAAALRSTSLTPMLLPLLGESKPGAAPVLAGVSLGASGCF
ncbi:MAG: hypothetical protein ABI895_13415 [Deltaproteobacteria bacterium]